MTASRDDSKARMTLALQRERARKGLSLSEAAKRAGISKSTLSQLESGAGNPSVETMWALAAAYEVQLSALIDPPRPKISLVRLHSLPQMPSSTADYSAALLSASPPSARRDIYVITAEPGSRRDSEPHPSGTVEHLIIGSGAARVVCAGETADMQPGDYLTYPGDQPHSFEALEAGTIAIYVVES